MWAATIQASSQNVPKVKQHERVAIVQGPRGRGLRIITVQLLIHEDENKRYPNERNEKMPIKKQQSP
jgi:hypothetical protein